MLNVLLLAQKIHCLLGWGCRYETGSWRSESSILPVSFQSWASLDQIQHLVLDHSEAIFWHRVIPLEFFGLAISGLFRWSNCWGLIVGFAEHHVWIDHFQNMCNEFINIFQGKDRKGYQPLLVMKRPEVASHVQVCLWVTFRYVSGVTTVFSPLASSVSTHWQTSMAAAVTSSVL